MELFRAKMYRISWSGDIIPKTNLSNDLQKQATRLLWENGYTNPMKFRLVHINGVTGFSSKLILLRRDKSLAILKNTEIMVIIKLCRGLKYRKTRVN